MIHTKQKYETKYGYFECRVKLQKEIGHWSAFWLTSRNIGKIIGNTAKSGTEIDIFEYLSIQKNNAHQALHWDGYGEYHKVAGNQVKIPDLSKGWHTFGLLWTEKRYTFYVDNKEVWTTTKAISQHEEYLRLSLEVGEWAGDISQAKLPDSFYVDYVRVYQKKD